jgi:phospholipid transport system transporter-binding protein
LAQLQSQIRSSVNHEVEIQAGTLSDFDSSALAVLLGCRREAESLSKSLKFKQFPAKLRQLALLYGVWGSWLKALDRKIGGSCPPSLFNPFLKLTLPNLLVVSL